MSSSIQDQHFDPSDQPLLSVPHSAISDNEKAALLRCTALVTHIVSVLLQGGYNLSSLAQSVCQTVQTLLGDPAPHPAQLGGPCERYDL